MFDPTDKIMASWLDGQEEEARPLADSSDFLDLYRIDLQHFLARFYCKGLVRGEDEEVREANRFEVGYWFCDDYLRNVDPLKVVSCLAPREVFHPNISPPWCCVGDITPGTPLVDLLYRSYEVISFQNLMPSEKDALNPGACSWARNNQHRFPIDDRPLKRRSGELPADAWGFSE